MASDFLHMIAEGIKEELLELKSFDLSIQEGKDHASLYLAALRNYKSSTKVVSLVFRIALEEDRAWLTDDSFNPPIDFEYADPAMLDDLYKEITKRYLTSY